jgi:hypothetical protein
MGYGFADTHINNHISEGASAGMKLFIVDPNGVDAIDTLRSRASTISEAPTEQLHRRVTKGFTDYVVARYSRALQAHALLL